ncbi:M23 family metallopeptidase [Thermosediminibacter litoriperuensis]|uniref:Peptidase M23-like protein n=1 Tax=Thermosediminibacter litoriperuensis TaxID=291989 RepID=A0A5S5AVQ5_9FIRM|nr:M23 family metallopeptidase [Thermosediminibacter litoriperuensis]TYP57419.1 peptidase M23-like protein [Thermosediminibacter litoriperuensis]
MKGRKRERFITLMIIPHSEKSTFSISVPFSFIKAVKYIAAGTAVAVAGASIYFFVSYRELKARNEELAVKAGKYEAVQARLEYFEEKTKSMEEKVKKLEELDASLREMLKNDPELKAKLDQKISPPSQPAGLASRSGIDRERALEQLEELDKKLEDQENSLEQLVAAVEARNKRLACTPSIWPLKGEVTSRFGYRRSPFGRSIEFHDGLDIAAPYGSPIKAAADGKVTFAGYMSGYGYTVEISHGYGIKTAYSHVSRILVKAGQQVKKGDIIARVGSSGRSTGPHLHYMVKVNGIPRNPEEYLD